MGRGFAAAALVVALATTGCATRGTAPAPSVPAAGTLRPLTDAEQLRVADAEQRLIGTCMTRQGFSFWEAERLPLEQSRTFGYVSDDVAWARRHGYGSRLRAQEDRARRTNPNLVYRAGLPRERRSAYDTALDGGSGARVISADVPGGGTVRKRAGGCVAEAELRLYGDPETWFRADKTASGLQPFYVPRVLADARFTAALSAWSDCMARAGHRFRDPAEARRAAGRRAPGSAPDEAFAAERALAAVDAACARDTSLRAVGEALETTYVNALRGRYGAALDTRARLQREALARAVRIVGPRA